MRRLLILNCLIAMLITACASTTINIEPGRISRTDIAAERGTVVIVSVEREIGAFGRVLKKRETRTIMSFYKPIPVEGYYNTPDRGLALKDL